MNCDKCGSSMALASTFMGDNNAHLHAYECAPCCRAVAVELRCELSLPRTA